MQRREFFCLGASLLVPRRRAAATNRFNIGQRVRQSYICDDHIDLENYGKVITWEGTITGMVFNHPDWSLDGWTYYIDWDLLNGQPAVVGHDFQHEDELEVV